MCAVVKKRRVQPRSLGALVAPGTAAAARVDDLKATALTWGFWTGAALLLGGGGYLLTRTVIRDNQQHNAQDNAATSGQPSYWADRLFAAFNPSSSGFSDGTDEELVFGTLREIPSRRMWEETVKAYSRLTRGGSLTVDLREEMTTLWSNDEWMQALAIINSKP